MNIFILEDNQERIKVFRKYYPKADIYTNVIDAKNHIKDKKYDIIFLDHDLGNDIYVPSEREDTGYQFAKYLEKEIDISFINIIIHSCNPVGARNIRNILGKGTCIPFPNFFKEK